MATAGLTKGLGDVMGISTTPGVAGSVTDHLQREVLKTGVGLAVNTAMGETFDNPLADGLKGVAVGTAGGVLAGQIGILYGKEMIDAVTHKVLHAGLGAMMGAALSTDIEKGAIAGAIGAVTAETVTDIVREDSDVVAGRVLERAKAEGIPLTPESINSLIYEEIQTTLHISRLSSAMATMLAGQNVGICIATAANAVENNATSLMLHGAKKALAGLLAVGTGVGGLLAKKQTEDIINAKMDAAPEDAQWADGGLTTEEGKPMVLATPVADPLPKTPGYDAVPEDLTRGHAEGFDAYEGPDTSVLEREYKVRIQGLTGKEGAKDTPSWARGERPYVGENGKEFAKRLCDAKYGKGTYKTGTDSDFNKLKKGLSSITLK
ncbi:MAG: hypothetical protein K2W94_07400 [Alphaproteobacteria bacterium]|nr:hypothetical protein [Alphaproteobacteria bacterium]